MRMEVGIVKKILREKAVPCSKGRPGTVCFSLLPGVEPDTTACKRNLFIVPILLIHPMLPYTQVYYCNSLY